MVKIRIGSYFKISYTDRESQFKRYLKLLMHDEEYNKFDGRLYDVKFL